MARKVADLLVETLIAHNVERIYGVTTYLTYIVQFRSRITVLVEWAIEDLTLV